MWFALEVAGPAGVLVVRLADSVPALLFGLHGGLLADRIERRRTMIAADLFRGAVLIPVAIAGLAGNLQLWGLVLAAFLLTAATSYFDPAYGALLPACR
jgi:MFS family permease